MLLYHGGLNNYNRVVGSFFSRVRIRHPQNSIGNY